MTETKIEYGIEQQFANRDWEYMHIWSVNSYTISRTTLDLDAAKQKLKDFRDWSELNNFNCQYRIVKTIITIEVLDE